MPLPQTNTGRLDNRHENTTTTASEEHQRAASSTAAALSGSGMTLQMHKLPLKKGPSVEADHFSLRTWIRNAPWSQYFKDGCRLIVKSPLNFFIFFCCLSVVVWGAFLVLLMGNMVKLQDNATQKLWIEIASQVLNGFFTIANVPVHPKRFLGFIRGVRIWREDNSVRQQFLDKFLAQQPVADAETGRTEKDRTRELLEMFDFYRCFPDYGRDRIEALSLSPIPEYPPAEASFGRSRSTSRAVAKVAVSRSRSRSKSSSRSKEPPSSSATQEMEMMLWNHGSSTNNSNTLHPAVVVDMESPAMQPETASTTATDNNTATATATVTATALESPLVSPAEAKIRVDISEDDLNELLSEETHRVVQSIVLPFLPFPLDMPTFSNDANNVADMDAAREQDAPVQSTESMAQMEQGLGVPPSNVRPPLTPHGGLQRGSSFATLSRMTNKRASPRTRARTMTMSMARDSDAGTDPLLSKRSTFVVHEQSPAVSHRAQTVDESASMHSVDDRPNASKGKESKEPPPLIPMPRALTQEQMDWIDGRQARLRRRQSRLQKAWPWYNYTMPTGIEPVDFFAPPEKQPAMLDGNWLRESTAGNNEVARAHGHADSSAGGVILLSSLPSDLVITPGRFCLIVGSFNLNSMIQEILCGFMWGVNYLVRPGWVVGTGMALGCLAAIVPSVLIMLHEHAMSKVRVVATAEEAIQDALDEKTLVKSP
ncbi:hypothetical protein BGZ70_007812 [Mortierella alpina]|uniref:Uncharacterized protein n=1 Tax=Mortierella alpina TaxID=64518 RepID=A0A9P6M2J5_MORAP|nr:hypothetical protein BGZ70_007812 [Mortierella alpina]